MSKSIVDLKKLIVDNFSTHYELNDKAHRVEHFEDVFQTGLIINEVMRNFFDPKLILFVAYFHDLFAWSRKNHHDLSCDFILETDHKVITQNLNSRERKIVAAGCQEHRASRTLPFTCTFTEMMNSADRGRPTSVLKMVDRSFLFTVANNPKLSEEAIAKKAVEHIKEKYGYGGYASYPECYSLTFKGVLEKQREEISNLTLEDYMTHRGFNNHKNIDLSSINLKLNNNISLN